MDTFRLSSTTTVAGFFCSETCSMGESGSYACFKEELVHDPRFRREKTFRMVAGSHRLTLLY
ncbi:MAG: hypothetical protein MUO54_14060 [Anaerolineales bacterium]|nr:hypothetical protein [Anaerolineales bacterium]